MRRLRRVGVGAGVALVVVVLVVVATGRSGSGTPPVDSGGGASPASDGAVASGPGDRFTIMDVDGSRVMRPGGAPGVLFFTASSCTSCVAQAAAMGGLKRKLGRRVEMLAVSIDPSDSDAAMRGFRKAAGNPPYPFAWDRSGVLASTFQVAALGTYVVYDARGRRVFRGVDSNIATIASALRRAGA